jgi:hypothetical protein
MTEHVLPIGEERFYDLLSFLVSSAFLLCQAEQDMKLYPSMRLMDGARRLTRSVIESGGFEDAEWPQKFVERCEASLNLLTSEQEAFVESVNEATRMVADEMKRRTASHSRL